MFRCFLHIYNIYTNKYAKLVQSRNYILLRGVVALCYQHKPLDNEVPQLHATQSEPLDYSNARSKETNRGTVYLDS